MLCYVSCLVSFPVSCPREVQVTKQTVNDDMNRILQDEGGVSDHCHFKAAQEETWRFFCSCLVFSSFLRIR